MKTIKIHFMRWKDAKEVTEGIQDSFKQSRTQMDFDQRKYTILYKGLSIISKFRFLFKRMMAVFVCRDEKDLLGSATLMPWEANTFLYSTINIWNKNRKKGLGKDLYFARNNYLIDNNIPYAVGEVLQDNNAARGFWTKYCGICWEFLSYQYAMKDYEIKPLDKKTLEKICPATKKEIAILMKGPWKGHPMIGHPSSVNSSFLKSFFVNRMIPPVKYQVLKFDLGNGNAVYTRFRQYFLVNFGFLDIWNAPKNISRQELEEAIKAISSYVLHSNVKRIWIYAHETSPIMREVLEGMKIQFLGASYFFRITVGKNKIEYLPEGPL